MRAVCVCVCHCSGMCGQSGYDQGSCLHHHIVHRCGLLSSAYCATCLRQGTATTAHCCYSTCSYLCEYHSGTLSVHRHVTLPSRCFALLLFTSSCLFNNVLFQDCMDAAVIHGFKPYTCCVCVIGSNAYILSYKWNCSCCIIHERQL